tara:strand:- start:1978 stop:2616 length:639 start_codon:yes stop_codon:yes gene_type:complete
MTAKDQAAIDVCFAKEYRKGQGTLMFGRNKDRPTADVSLQDTYIQLNEKNIASWLGSDADIGWESKWTHNDSNVVTHIISYFPKARVHHHRTPNVFSESIAGGYRTPDDLDIEWHIRNDHFVVTLPGEEKLLFRCPISRVSQMISTGNNSTRNLRGESNMLQLEPSDDSSENLCSTVVEETWDTYQLCYSNDFVKVIFEVAPKHNVIYYNDY